MIIVLYEIVLCFLGRPIGKEHTGNLLGDFAAAPSAPVAQRTRPAPAGRQLQANSVGYRLLAKAGWTGRGLGAEETGITTPVAAWTQSGPHLVICRRKGPESS